MDQRDSMENVVATVSGYRGSGRFNLIRQITQCGGSYVGALTRSTTHLICWKFGGDKYDLARRLNIWVVNNRWIEACVQEGKRVPEHPYTLHSGEEMGPLLSKMHKRVMDPVEKFSRVRCLGFFEESQINWPTSSLLDERMVQKSSEKISLGNRKRRRERRTRERGSSASVEEEEQGDHTVDDNGREPSQQEQGEHQHEEHATDDNDRDPSQQSSSSDLSCVICWTNFSPTRGLLPCGHRFCFTCIEYWASHLASNGKSLTCPLCKSSFDCIGRLEDVPSSDQKIYSQTVPALVRGDGVPTVRSSRQDHVLDPACFACGCVEPVDLLLSCHVCRSQRVHSYCLDPYLMPWTCSHCKDLRRLLCT